MYEKVFKRPLDVFLSTIALIVFSPLLLTLSILVRVKLGSPVMFRQDRIGKDERVFKLYKFRSMTNEKDENGQLLSDDIRLTKFGRTLRRSSLDELLELINIVKGDMSIVGPRPLLIEYLPFYTEREKHRHDVRPGLTGLAQVNGRNAISWDLKLEYDVQYASKITLAGDLKIILNTVVKTIKGSDIQVGSGFEAGKFIDQRIAREKEKLEKMNEN
ncbi:MAG: sugar transferase [Parasporobacterium sp.]|nr:sugar transferase [Parasporobacterium sp.]